MRLCIYGASEEIGVASEIDKLCESSILERRRGRGTCWQTFLLPAQAPFQVLGLTKFLQSERVASSVVPQWTPTEANADGATASVAKMVRAEKNMVVQLIGWKLLEDVWFLAIICCGLAAFYT